MSMESQIKLKQGERAPYFKLMGVDGKFYSKDDFKNKKALLIIFMCNHCPYVKAKIKLINELHANYSNKNVAVVGISSNDAIQYPDDSFENMKLFAQEHNIEYPYLYDETQEVAQKYGAQCTPDPFLFDENFELAYHGRLNDAMSPEAKATSNDMKSAIESVLRKKKPETFFVPSIGCGIKWKK